MTAGEDHVAAGWDADHTQRWIEVGRLRLEEDDTGALALLPPTFGQSQPVTRLSAAELANLVRLLAGWFADDPTPTIRQIEDLANYVRTELEGWNDRARGDEEHPPYEELTRALDGLLGRCRDLREVAGRFGEKPKTITIAEGALKP